MVDTLFIIWEYHKHISLHLSLVFSCIRLSCDWKSSLLTLLIVFKILVLACYHDLSIACVCVSSWYWIYIMLMVHQDGINPWHCPLTITVMCMKSVNFLFWLMECFLGKFCICISYHWVSCRWIGVLLIMGCSNVLQA